MSRAIRQFVSVCAAGLLLSGCASSLMPSVHSETERLALARRQMSQQHWASASELLKSYIQNNAGGAAVDQAIYLLGECYLHTKEWPLAVTEFEKLIRDYPESDSTASASFQLAAAYFGQTRPPDFDQEYTAKALDQWQKYLADFPGHWRNPEAERRIVEGRSRIAMKLLKTGQLYLKLDLPTPARTYFGRIVDEYADTTLVPDAMLGLALADAREGLRTEAIARLREIETVYRGHAAAQRAAHERSRLERKRS